MKILTCIRLCLLLAFIGTLCRAQEADSLLFLQKVRYARSLGLDTLPHITSELQLYKRSLLLSNLRDAYLPQTAAAPAERAVVRQVFKRTPQNISKARLLQLQQQIDSVYQLARRGVSFEELVRTVSDEPKPIVIERLQMPVEFEDQAFSLPIGQISAPFASPLGLHIIQVVSRGTATTESQASVGSQGGADAQLLPVLTTALKSELSFQQNEENCRDLIRRGESDRVLFTIAGHAYTGTDFARFRIAHAGGTAAVLSDYVTHALLQEKMQRMEADQTALSAQHEDYFNRLLVSEATLREVLQPSQDELALKTYFDTHQEEFRWPQERYRGILIQATTKKLAKRAAKLLKKQPYDQWETLLSQRYGAELGSTMRYQKGIFAMGDNIYVDDLAFKGPDADPDAQYPYAVVQGKKIKGPESWEGVPRETLVLSFQQFLENQWQKRLKSMK